jgi:hypothetical protein
MHRVYAVRLAFPRRFPFPQMLLGGCQRAGEYAIKGRLIHATQPWFVFGLHVLSYAAFDFSIGRPFDRWDHGFCR